MPCVDRRYRYGSAGRRGLQYEPSDLFPVGLYPRLLAGPARTPIACAGPACLP